MASLNQANIMGYVGDEPKIINTQSGRKMATFSLATTERGYTRQDGSQVAERTEWHNIVVWGKQAEIIERYIHKGSCIFVQGKIRTRSYNDRNGDKRYATEIEAEIFQMCDRKGESPVSGSNTPNAQGYQSTSRGTDKGDDDLPF